MLLLLAEDSRVAHVDIVVSDHAMRVVAEEHGLPAGRSGFLDALLHIAGPAPGFHLPEGKFSLLENSDIGAGIASGSYPSDGMIVLPCSMDTLASISHGMASRLIVRAADVCLKERRPLLLCIRETPFNLIHIRNMAAATEAGATVFPVIPAYYNKPENITEMAIQFCCRVLGHVGLPQHRAYRWKADDLA